MIVPLAVVVGFLVVGFVFVLARLASQRVAPQSAADWLDNFSLESYAPMERLLDKGDVKFLASQPGYRPEIGKRLMAERRKIFGNYLRLLVHDFNELISIGKLVVVYSTHDRAEFARTLLRHQAKFYFSVCAVRLQLALYPLEWTLVDVGDLVQAVDTMRNQVQQLAVRRAAVGVTA